MIAEFYNNGTNYIQMLYANNTTIRVTFRVAGAVTDEAWTCGGAILAGVTYTVDIKYNATQFTLSIDGLVVDTGTPVAGIDFGANIPNTANMGHNQAGTNQSDVVFSP